jgi:hypothetical protein
MIQASYKTVTRQISNMIRLPIELPQVNWRQYEWIIVPLLAFLISRMVVFAAAVIGDLMLPADPGHWDPTPGNHLLGLWARWDSQWYDWIVNEGYWLRPGQRSNVAFFPMYPLIISTIKPILGNNAVLAGVLVSNIAFLAALIFLYRLTDLEFGDRQGAGRTVVYLAIFPTAFFFSMMYSESLFLLFTVAAFYFARRHLWAWAALMGLLASATRVIGVLTWGFLMWEWLRIHGWTIESIHRRETWGNLWLALRKDWFSVLIIAVIPLGLLSYMAFLQLTFKDPIAFSTVQSAWGRENIGPIAVVLADIKDIVVEGASQGTVARVLNLATLITFTGASVIVWRKLGAGYAIYTLLAILIPSTSASQSLIRYAIVCFPVFMIAGVYGRNIYLDRIWLVLSGMLLGILTIIFVNWVFVA